MMYKRIFLFLGLLLLLGAPAMDCGAIAETPYEPEMIYVPIIMYHEVKPYRAGKDAIQPWELDNDLTYLDKNGYTTITMGDLIDYVYHDFDLPEKPIVLTFDDGYLNNYIYAFPILEKHSVKVVLSIIGKNTDDFTDIPDDNTDYSHVTWMQLREMLDSGLVEVQNHTYNLHKSRGRLGCRRLPFETNEEYEQALTDDIMKLQRELTLITGRTPNTFAYPYGKASDIDRKSVV